MNNLAEIMRPKTLDEVIGNKHITDPLKRQLADGKLSQTILLTGPSGTGKTTIANILANELEAEVLRVDCGSDGGVERARQVVESARLSSLFGPKKAYLLDEAHQLTPQAQSALLETLEVLNPGVHFILMTTDPDKLMNTIRTRAVRYQTHPASNEDVGVAVNRVLDKYKLEVEDKRDFWEVIRQAGGSLRAVYTILEKVITASDEKGFISSEKFKDVVGVVTDLEEKVQLGVAQAFMTGKLKETLQAINQAKQAKLSSVGTTIGAYNYLRAVYLRSGKAVPHMMADLAHAAANKRDGWEHLEAIAWKHLR